MRRRVLGVGNLLVIFVQQGGQFKINDTKPTVGLPIGDVAQKGVIVADAILVQLVINLLHASFRHVFDAGTAIGGDHVQRLIVGF